ncbi:MAG: hypothetical protein K5843_03330 [Bacteroidales bacterium]|jgi:hypothetical protein|nr:hypothetical protein [Bacteroidales bacterium]
MKGITKKQFYIQIITVLVQLVIGVFWIVNGIIVEKAVSWILGTIILVSAIIMILAIVFQYRKNPMDDAVLSKQSQLAINGMAMLSGLIGLGCLLAFLFASLLS